MKTYTIQRSTTRWLLAGDVNHPHQQTPLASLLALSIILTYALLGWAW